MSSWEGWRREAKWVITVVVVMLLLGALMWFGNQPVSNPLVG